MSAPQNNEQLKDGANESKPTHKQARDADKAQSWDQFGSTWPINGSITDAEMAAQGVTDPMDIRLPGPIGLGPMTTMGAIRKPKPGVQPMRPQEVLEGGTIGDLFRRMGVLMDGEGKGGGLGEVEGKKVFGPERPPKMEGEDGT
ncbi:hypothetical protein LTS10_004420 [Elasticomyces elasticus]|nr:hypothetical protein LTS10_004420 [Elasticomyces elasticus]